MPQIVINMPPGWDHCSLYRPLPWLLVCNRVGQGRPGFRLGPALPLSSLTVSSSTSSAMELDTLSPASRIQEPGAIQDGACTLGPGNPNSSLVS